MVYALCIPQRETVRHSYSTLRLHPRIECDNPMDEMYWAIICIHLQ